MFSLDKFVDSLKPNGYWFISCYLSVLCLSPFLALAFNAFTRQQLLALGLLFAASFIFLSSHSAQKIFVACFVIAAYIRLHVPQETQNNRRICIVLILAMLAMMLWPLYCRASGQPGIWFNCANMQSIPVLVLSACLLLLFRNLKLGHIPWINTIAAATLGIYLIHDNNIVRPWLWKQLLHVSAHLESTLFPLWSVVVVAGVFAACCIVEHVRRLLLTPVFDWLLKPVDALDKRLAAFFAIAPGSR